MPDTPSISRDELAHLATLARIDLSDAELDHLAPQLSAVSYTHLTLPTNREV